MPRLGRLIDKPHAVPPRVAQAFIWQSVLAGGAGWSAVDQVTRRRTRHGTVFGFGDAGSTPNANIAAARDSKPRS